MADDATPTMSITPFFDAKPSQPPSFRPESHPQPTQRRPPTPLSHPSLLSSSCFSFHDLSSASQPASQASPVPGLYSPRTTMMRSLAAIFPGFLPPLAVINATDPLPPERETTTKGGKRERKRKGRRGRERERDYERREFTDTRRESSTRRGHC